MEAKILRKLSKNSIGVQSLMVMPSKLWRFEWSGGGIVKEKIEDINK